MSSPVLQYFKSVLSYKSPVAYPYFAVKSSWAVSHVSMETAFEFESCFFSSSS